MKHLTPIKNITTCVLSWACMLSCDSTSHVENTYELLICQTYRENFNDKEKFDESDTKIKLIAVERDKKRILQQVYCDNVHLGYDGLYVAGKNILRDGLQKHRNSLKDPHDCFVLKPDFNRFSYRDYDVDLTKGDNYMFLSNRLNPSRTHDSIPLNELPEHSIILVESDYTAKIGDSIRIPHASRLIRSVYSHIHSDYPEYVKHTIVYDRNRQTIVASERRHAYTDKLLSKYELVKVIRLTREDFYQFWTGGSRMNP